MQLHDKLQAVAQGDSFYGEALYEALEHPLTTKNDKSMLMRYLYGSELTSDRMRLQELAIYIQEYDKAQSLLNPTFKG